MNQAVISLQQKRQKKIELVLLPPKEKGDVTRENITSFYVDIINILSSEN